MKYYKLLLHVLKFTVKPIKLSKDKAHLFNIKSFQGYTKIVVKMLVQVDWLYNKGLLVPFKGDDWWCVGSCQQIRFFETSDRFDKTIFSALSRFQSNLILNKKHYIWFLCLNVGKLGQMLDCRQHNQPDENFYNQLRGLSP